MRSSKLRNGANHLPGRLAEAACACVEAEERAAEMKLPASFFTPPALRAACFRPQQHTHNRPCPSPTHALCLAGARRRSVRALRRSSVPQRLSWPRCAVHPMGGRLRRLRQTHVWRAWRHGWRACSARRDSRYRGCGMSGFKGWCRVCRMAVWFVRTQVAAPLPPYKHTRTLTLVLACTSTSSRQSLPSCPPAAPQDGMRGLSGCRAPKRPLPPTIKHLHTRIPYSHTAKPFNLPLYSFCSCCAKQDEEIERLQGALAAAEDAARAARQREEASRAQVDGWGGGHCGPGVSRTAAAGGHALWPIALMIWHLLERAGLCLPLLGAPGMLCCAFSPAAYTQSQLLNPYAPFMPPQGREWAERSRRGEALCEEYEAELAQVGWGGRQGRGAEWVVGGWTRSVPAAPFYRCLASTKCQSQLGMCCMHELAKGGAAPRPTAATSVQPPHKRLLPWPRLLTHTPARPRTIPLPPRCAPRARQLPCSCATRMLRVLSWPLSWRLAPQRWSSSPHSACAQTPLCKSTWQT